jgi:hypothetical protein
VTPPVPIKRERGRRDRGERRVAETPLARTVEASGGAGIEERTQLENFTICSKACMLRPSLTGW